MQIYCKLDNLQRTGSFKERGARNALAQLSPEQKKRGVIAASAGNHAQALAYQGRLLGIPATVVMPKFAPLIKMNNCQKLGATVVLHGKDFAEAKARAHEIAEEKGLAYIDGYDDPAIIAGQGTAGLEIVAQVPDLDAVIVPVGGGGSARRRLAGGENVCARRCEVIAVEADHVASFSAALSAGKPVRIETRPTLADGLAIAQVGDNAFEIARRHTDKIVLVNEEQIALAILRIVELEKGVVEGAAATTLAACHVRTTSRARRQARRSSPLRRQHRSERPQPRDRARPRGRRPPLAFHRRDQRSAGRPGRSHRANRGGRRKHQTGGARPRLRQPRCLRGQRPLHGRDARPRSPRRNCSPASRSTASGFPSIR